MLSYLLSRPQDDIRRCGHTVVETDDLESVLPETDVLYVTRIQQERFETAAEYEAVKGKYKVTAASLRLLKERMCILHPLPRVDEISPEVCLVTFPAFRCLVLLVL